MRNARRWRAAGIAAAWGLVMAACSSEPESTAPTVELSTTTVTTLPPTTVTTEAPAATVDPRIAEVEAAVAAFRETQVRVLTDPDASVELMSEVASGDVLESNLALIAGSRSEARVITGSFPFTPIETQFVSGELATHLQCGRDQLASTSADGELIIPADEVAFLRLYSLTFDDPIGWIVYDIAFPGTEKSQCEL